MEYSVILTTVDSKEAARKLAGPLVEEQLAACVQILPGVESVYFWKGEVQQDGELLLLCKTRRELVERLASRLAELHPYEEPEIIALPVQWGARGYLDWLVENTRDA